MSGFCYIEYPEIVIIVIAVEKRDRLVYAKAEKRQ